jgi:hypothetical protein
MLEHFPELTDDKTNRIRRGVLFFYFSLLILKINFKNIILIYFKIKNILKNQVIILMNACFLFIVGLFIFAFQKCF